MQLSHKNWHHHWGRGQYPGTALVSQVPAFGDDGWGWATSEVEEPQCYLVTALDDRARLYELRVTVAWGTP